MPVPAGHGAHPGRSGAGQLEEGIFAFPPGTPALCVACCEHFLPLRLRQEAEEQFLISLLSPVCLEQDQRERGATFSSKVRTVMSRGNQKDYSNFSYKPHQFD